MICHQDCDDSWVPETLVYLDNLNGQTTDKKLQTLKNLKYLRLGMNNIITDDGIKNLHNLEYLDLQGNSNITNHGIRNLLKLRELLVGFNENVTEDGYKHLPLLTIINTKLIFPGFGEVLPLK
jgi:Leucine-rich repeat (LRR) protein